MKNQMLALAMMVATGAAAAGGPWYVEGTNATYPTDSGVSIAVGFLPDDSGQCSQAGLVIIGNADVAEIGFCTDKACFSSDYVDDKRVFESGVGAAALMISDQARDALANHNVAQIQTNAGNVTISLKGSRAAMIEAHRQCIRDAHQPLEPTVPRQPSQPAESQDQFRIYEGGVML